jgi:Carboxypeptidase regulatory-like domain
MMAMRGWVRLLVAIQCVGVLVLGGAAVAGAQELGGAGTVQGIVKDPTGGAMVAATVTISNPVSGFRRETTTDPMGRFVFRNLPPNPYHVEASAQGFQTLARDVTVRSAVPIELDLSLQVGVAASVEVVGHAEELLERDPTAHTDVDQSLIQKLPVEVSAGINQIVTLASPGVVADSNSFFHPIGDHAQTQFSIDNQPVTDQQSRIYSNQISSNAVQSM